MWGKVRRGGKCGRRCEEVCWGVGEMSGRGLKEVSGSVVGGDERWGCGKVWEKVRGRCEQVCWGVRGGEKRWGEVRREVGV